MKAIELELELDDSRVKSQVSISRDDRARQPWAHLLQWSLHKASGPILLSVSMLWLCYSIVANANLRDFRDRSRLVPKEVCSFSVASELLPFYPPSAILESRDWNLGSNMDETGSHRSFESDEPRVVIKGLHVFYCEGFVLR